MGEEIINIYEGFIQSYNLNRVNISEKNKCFVWTPPKTASNLAQKVFENFDFNFVDFSKKDPLTLFNGFFHNHTIHLFDGHEGYNFILTTRNPYSQKISYILMKNPKPKSIMYELEFDNRHLKKYDSYLLNNLRKRKPDYVIRQENIYEDLIKIPFIVESKLFREDKLKEIVQNKPNKNETEYNWKDYINKDVADLIYYSNSLYFDMFGYDKDSWKK